MSNGRHLNVSLAILVCFVVSASPATAGTIYVPTDHATIQAAIDAAVNGDEIEVAPGTYSEGIDFLGKAIRLYSTAGPQVTTIDGTGHYHVVQCVSSESNDTILEGLTITGGNANGADWDRVGGGMLNYLSDPTVTDCIFIDNSASYKGGGMHNDQSDPIVTKCIFNGNSAESTVVLTKGGGMYNSGSNPKVTDCYFTGNSAFQGGGMHTDWMSPTVTNCMFVGNSAVHGGGMNNNVSNIKVTNCTFIDNWGNLGGGMHNNNYYTPVVTNCTFIGNSADHGGAMWNNYSNAIVTNCILWNDTPDEIEDNDNSTAIFNYCDVQGGWPGTGNIDLDPVLVDADGRLSPGSPCIDAGDNSAVPAGITTDLDGNARIADGTVDMGAYECHTTLVQIDIKPGSYPNAININGNGVIPVAIVGSAEFDVTQVVIDSLSFAGLEVRVKPNGVSQCSISDVTGPEGVPDGFNDLVCQFVDDPLQWLPGDGVADLTGTFLVGGEAAPFKGTDEITIVP